MASDVLKRAARLYSLAQVAFLDCGGSETDLQADVQMQAIRSARQSLRQMGYDYSTLGSLQNCIDAALKSTSPDGGSHG
jgi:hypothetical protein